jgi:hypothetical protein
MLLSLAQAYLASSGVVKDGTWSDANRRDRCYKQKVMSLNTMAGIHVGKGIERT